MPAPGPRYQTPLRISAAPFYYLPALCVSDLDTTGAAGRSPADLRTRCSCAALSGSRTPAPRRILLQILPARLRPGRAAVPLRARKDRGRARTRPQLSGSPGRSDGPRRAAGSRKTMLAGILRPALVYFDGGFLVPFAPYCALLRLNVNSRFTFLFFVSSKQRKR